MNFSIKKIFVILLAITVVGTFIYAIFESGVFYKNKGGDDQAIPEDTISLPEMTVIPGVTSESEIKNRTGIISVEDIDGGFREYRIESGMYLNPNRVIVDKSTVVYESIVPNPSNYKKEDYPTIIATFTKFGDPEVIFEGSVDFGPFVRTYVYPLRGFAFVGNPSTDEVLQMQFFVPVTREEYVSNYATDFKTPENAVREGI